MTAPTDLVPGEFVKVSVTQRLISLFGDGTVEQTYWFFARYVSTVDHQIVIEHADGSRKLVDLAQVHALDTAVASGGAS